MARSTGGLQTPVGRTLQSAVPNHIGPLGADISQDENFIGVFKASLGRMVNAGRMQGDILMTATPKQHILAIRYIRFWTAVVLKQIAPLAALVVNRMGELGLSQAEVSRRAGFNAAFMSDLLRGKKLRLHDANYNRLARALLTTEHYLQTGERPSDDILAKVAEAAGFHQSAEDGSPLRSDDDLDALAHLDAKGADNDPQRSLGKVPLFRSAGRLDGGSVVTDHPLDIIEWPQNYQVDRLYGLAISDGTMSPRYEPGDIVYALRGDQPHIKDYCIITVNGRSSQRRQEVAFVRQVLSLAQNEVIVRQLAPNIETRYRRSAVLRLDSVLIAGKSLNGLGFNSR